jgi:hypothetical protein
MIDPVAKIATLRFVDEGRYRSPRHAERICLTVRAVVDGRFGKGCTAKEGGGQHEKENNILQSFYSSIWVPNPPRRHILLKDRSVYSRFVLILRSEHIGNNKQGTNHSLTF